MNKPLSVLVLLLSLAVCRADVTDDFSGDDWKLFDSTPGTLAAVAGKLTLVDAAEEPSWVTASKSFKVDVDQTPYFLVNVVELNNHGQVKLIRRTPYDKREVLSIDQVGLWLVDLKQLKWSGPCEIEVCLYATGDESEITYSFVKFAAAATAEEQARIKERVEAGNPGLSPETFELVPLFTTCSYYFRTPELPSLSVQYRQSGQTWRTGYPPVWAPEDGMYRGSVVDLSEDTAYDLQLVDAQGQVLRAGEFRTWSSTVSIAKTIVLDETNFDGHLVIRDQGTPDGWIRYTAKPGFVLRNDRSKSLLDVTRAKYVLLEGLTLRGGSNDGIAILQCDHVRVLNCDLAGWGRDGVQRFDKDGKFYTAGGSAINWDTGIRLSRTHATLIERCWIHDPVSRANSWYYSHPAGPQAVGADKPTSTVIRYNDFVGSDAHRWNDAIEGAGNFDRDGGFNRDAEIYGEFHCFANDDAIEIDGGQINVRVHDNKFEGCLCGISIQGCMSGPSYLYRNLLVNMGDERNLAGQTIKTSSNVAGEHAVSHIFNNTTYGDSSDLGLLKILKVVAENNLFAGRSAIRNRQGSPQSFCDYNLQVNLAPGEEEEHGLSGDAGLVDPAAGRYELKPDSQAIGKGTETAGFTSAAGGKIDLGAIPSGSGVVLPLRPIPLELDRYQLNWSQPETAAAATKTVTVTVAGNAFESPYRIAQNDAFDWFTVTPSSGILKSGETQTFTVKILSDKLPTLHRLHKGVFLIRLEDGYSRPVLVYAENDYVQPVKPTRDGVWVQYLEAESAAGGKPYQVVDDPTASGGKCLGLEGSSNDAPAELRFTVPKAGKYHLLLRIKSPEPVSSHDSLYFALDDAKEEQTQLRSDTSWSWCMAAHNRSMSLICLESFDLKAGEHVLKLVPRESLSIDLVAVTDNPEMFE